ncbi:MAG: efflux RND transporter permease subunit [Proteobacteria bacterium]|nr:efflux RND transporter permease subunit [Pseudomonadota bacterium]MCL2307101.1 efflux RND transporter permease subunit [Pseudomonadota bacterium]
MSHFFIDRPIFAWVIAIIISLAGALSIFTLPVSQYPEIAPPMIQVRANFQGASAKTVEDSVTQVIEQQMRGLDHLLYMTSTSDSYGNAMVRLTFDVGTNADIAQVQVQNKLQAAMPLLPDEVQRMGLTVTKSSASFLMISSYYSADGSMSQPDLVDYVATNVLDPISRVDGVGEVQLFGAQYAMRIWIDPAKMHKYKVIPSDIVAAVREQNIQVSVGQLGGSPAVAGQQINATVTAQSRLQTVDQFENILLRVERDGSQVLLKDVARVEIGSERYDVTGRFSGRPAAGMAISLASGANALATAERVKAKVAELQQYFPPGMTPVFPYDTTPFVKASIWEVAKTLMEAIFLVFLVMLLFLQSFRATMIPMLAVPVVLLGTFGLLAVFGYSINMLTMFALVLAVGLLVDDAIVVVENAERLMTEEKLSPRDAARKSMTQITGALVGIVMVLCAVLVPMAFFGGAPGVIYRQFAVTLVSALALSLLVAIVLTPALCATMMKSAHKGDKHEKRGFFGWFNRMFTANTKRYQTIVAFLIKAPFWGMLVYFGIIAIVVMMFMKLPKSFLPDEDQGAVIVLVQLPSGATRERTLQAIEHVERYFLEHEKEAVDATMALVGTNIASGGGQNMGNLFIRLKDWDERADPFFKKLKNWVTRENPRLSAKGVAERGMKALDGYRDASIHIILLPTIQGLGLATGFEMYLQDRAGMGHEALMTARNQLLGMARQNELLMNVRPGGQEDAPQFKIEIDQPKAKALGLTQSVINSTLSAAWGGVYINDFLDKGRVKRVYMQSEAEHRMLPENIKDWYVRNNQGQMVPFSAFTTSRWEFGSPRLERFNGLPAVQISGAAKQGQSSGTAMDIMEAMVKKLDGFGLEWSGVSFQEKVAGDKANLLFVLSLVVVFLCLAALYESWAIPLSVVLVVPLGIIGMLLAMKTRGFENDIFFHVGLVTIMGLSAKNAILIVEFAKSAQERGKALIDATLEAVQLRLRPVLMTSLAFGFGVLPLTFKTGAGSGGQNVIGTGVVGGLFSTTALGIFLIPVFYVVVRSIFKHNYDKNKPAPAHSTTEGF